MLYEQRNINTEYSGTAGFVIATIAGSPAKRSAIARLFVTAARPGSPTEEVAAASAADNFVAQVISSAFESLTAPVPSHAKWKVAVDGDADVRVLFIALHDCK
jgi:hypothetical protein